ncbi:unnamed protein product [Clonostachys byssicola]|uniref:Uncharacterized protein n=1 Tax=Clonostachys byssicola TaxID=160290 RepID=A0A9N9U871_9HYPO|nr:unnamed protein product [Clonostachys byssicola]
MASTQEDGEKPLNASEKAYLKENWGDEFHFLRDHGLKIYNEEDRSDGRAILRAFRKSDSLPEEDHSPSGANEAAHEFRNDDHFRAGDRAEENQYQHQIPRGFAPAHGFDYAGSSVYQPAQDPALVSAGGGEQHQGPTREYRMNPNQFGHNHDQSGAFDGGYQGRFQGGRQDGYHGGRDDVYVGGHSFVREGCDNPHDAGSNRGYDDGSDSGHDDGSDDVYEDGDSDGDSYGDSDGYEDDD